MKAKLTDEIELSVLVCTLTNRVTDFLPNIITELEKQAKEKPVEVLYLGDNRKRSIGAKRNDLLLLSQGKYVCFVDDDDEIADDYIKMILGASKVTPEPDVIVFQAMYFDEIKQIKKPVKYSIEFQKDFEDKNFFYRLPNHLMPVKMDILRKVWFKEMNFGEDFDFAKQLKPHIATQASINKILYYYNFNQHTSESRK